MNFKAEELKEVIWRVHPGLREKMESISSVWGRDWLYLTIDKRFVKINGMESRLAVSYEKNETPRGILAPPVQSGDMVFGLHNIVVIENNRIGLLDSWLDSFPAENLIDIAQIETESRIILGKYNDLEYEQLTTFDGEIGDDYVLYGGFGISKKVALEEFIISDEVMG